MLDELAPILVMGFIMKAMDAGVEHLHYRQITEKMADLMATLGSLSARIEAVESGSISGESVHSAVDALGGRIDSVATRIEDLDARKADRRGTK